MPRETKLILKERITMQDALIEAATQRLARATGVAFAVGGLIGAVCGFALGLAF